MATRPNPYLKKDPGDLMLAADWNEVQVQSREELAGKLAAHGHTGGDDASPIARAGIAPNAVDGTRIDPQSDVALKSLKVNGRVLLDEIDKLLASVAGVSSGKLDQAGGIVAGSLTVKQDLSVGGRVVLNDGTVSLRSGTDPNHGLGWFGATKAFAGWAGDGPVLFGNLGGALGTSSGGQKTALSWDAAGNLSWSKSQLIADQGGSIELGGTNAAPGTGTPFIDFHFKGKQEDFNVRVINDADKQLTIAGNLQVSGNAGLKGAVSTGALTVGGDLAVTGKLIRLSLAGGGGGQLVLANNPNDNRVYLEAYNTTGDGNAAELLLTGFQSQAVPQLSLYAGNTTATGSLTVNGTLTAGGFLRAAGVIVDPNLPDHIVTDGSFYRWGGQVYINVDDNLYIKDSTRGVRMHFDTVNGIFKSDKLRLADKWILSGVGDGIANDDWLRLVGAGNQAAYWGGLAAGRLWTAQGSLAGSDLRLKHDIATIDGALAKVGAIRGVTYLLNDAPGHGEQAGVVAQEVEAVFPQVVCDGPDGMKGVNYNGMIGLLVEAIKEQQIQIDALRAETKSLGKLQ